MTIREHEKFALIALGRAGLAQGFPEYFDLGDGLFVARSFPGKPDSHWREWLGSIHAERLEGAKLYLGSKAPSATPEILDAENQNLERRVNFLYLSLFLTDYVRLYEAPVHFTGSMLPNGCNVRSIGDIQQPFFVPGTPMMPEIDTTRLLSAAELAGRLEKIYTTSANRRFKRVLNTFQAALRADYADIRLHQFIRCVEGFILPETGNSKSQFRSRTEVFIGPRHHSLIGELYDLRSSAEHMHDVFEILPPPAKREKLTLLFHRAFEAEGLAQYCIRHFLADEKLWDYFKDDSALIAFWNLDLKAKETIWGAKLDMDALSKRFESKWVRDEDFAE